MMNHLVRAFALGPLAKNSVVGLVKHDSDEPVVDSYKLKRVETPLGISLQEVVHIDETSPRLHIPHSQAIVGGRIDILIRGDIVWHFDFLEIPALQPLYLSKIGTIDWRKVGPRIGHTVSSQDLDGYVNIHLNFRRL